MHFDSIHLIGQKKNNTKKSRNIIYLTYNLLSDGDFRKNILKIKEEVFHLIMREKKEKIINILFNLFQRFLKNLHTY